jgi:hypothetical protein
VHIIFTLLESFSPPSSDRLSHGQGSGYGGQQSGGQW